MFPLSQQLYLGNSGRFVAVSVSNTNVIAYSDNGINWNTTTSPITQSCGTNSVTFGNGYYIICGNSGQPLYSLDGINWSTSPSTSIPYGPVTYGNGTYVVLKEGIGPFSPDAAYSTDGINWTTMTLPNFSPSTKWVDIAHGRCGGVDSGNIFVALNSQYFSSVTSPDGITWTQTVGSLPYTALWNSITFGNNKFIATCAKTAPNVAISTNGTTWSPAGNSTFVDYQNLSYGNGQYTSFQSPTTGQYSINGITWNSLSTPSSGIADSVWGNQIYVAIDGSFLTPKGLYSRNGTTWSLTTMPAPGGWNAVCFGQLAQN